MIERYPLITGGNLPMSKRRINFIVAPPLVLGGLWCIALPFAFARMRDPDIPLGWGEYLGLIVSQGTGAIGLGMLLIVLGVWIGVAGSKRG